MRQMDGEEETCGTQGDLCGTLRKRQPLYKQKQGSAERTGVSRSHSSREVKDRISRSLEYNRERRSDHL